MEYILPVPSLQHLAVFKIVTHLWNQPDILTQTAHIITINLWTITSLPGPIILLNEATIERKVKEKASALPLPKLCIRLLLNVIKPLKDEVFTWFGHLQRLLVQFRPIDSNYFLKPLIWTTLATVDYKKMMQLIVKDESLDVAQRFKLACFSCLEDETCELISRISEDQRRTLINWPWQPKYHQEFVAFWTSGVIYDGNVDKPKSFSFARITAPYLHLFTFAEQDGNRAACDYFFEKLSEKVQENNSDIKQVLYAPIDCKTMCYFSRFSEEQQEIVLARCWFVLVQSILSWPYQALFLGTIKRWSHLIHGDGYIKVLDIVLEKIIHGYQDYDYSRAFLEVWQLTPADVRKSYLSNQRRLQVLLGSGRKDLINLVLKEGSVDRIDMLVFKEYHAIKRALREQSAISDHDLMEYRRTLKRNKRIRLRCENILGLLDRLIGKRSRERYYEEGNF